MLDPSEKVDFQEAPEPGGKILRKYRRRTQQKAPGAISTSRRNLAQSRFRSSWFGKVPESAYLWCDPENCYWRGFYASPSGATVSCKRSWGGHIGMSEHEALDALINWVNDQATLHEPAIGNQARRRKGANP